MRRLFLMLCLTAVTAGSLAQFRSLERRNHSVNKQLGLVASSPDFKTAGFAFLAQDLKSGETIAAMNPDMALRPASTLKLLTTATALELLGPDHQFETGLSYTGEVDTTKRLLEGNIIVKGGGDPTLGSSYLEDSSAHQFLSDWVSAIRELGIDSVAGRIIGDATYFSRETIPPSWSWGNMGQYYGAGPCGLSVYDNSYTIHFQTGENVGDTAVVAGVTPDIPGLTFHNKVTADSISYDNAYIFGAPYVSDRAILGQIPLNKIDLKVGGSIPDPALLVAQQLENRLKQEMVFAGKPATTGRLIQLEGKSIPEPEKQVYSLQSPSLAEIITLTNTHSINLFAEHCLIHSGITLGAVPETTNSADSVLSFWTSKGMDTRGFSMADGSGLSHQNAITPRQLVFLLTYMKRISPHFDAFYESMAIAGETGTLEQMFRGTVAEGEIRAKSGTIDRVKAYAGYVTSASGREIAFTMVVNNFSGTATDATAKLERLMVALAEFNK